MSRVTQELLANARAREAVAIAKTENSDREVAIAKTENSDREVAIAKAVKKPAPKKPVNKRRNKKRA